MTTGQSDSSPGSPDPARLQVDLARLEELSRRLVAALGRRRPHDPGLDAPGQELFLKAALAWMSGALSSPARLFGQQADYWSATLRSIALAGQAQEEGPDAAAEAPEDPRFASPLWEQHPYFRMLKRQYQLNEKALEETVRGLEGLDERERRRLAFFSRQIMSMFNPANFLATNPEALARAAETGGESLLRGLENLVRDLEANDGELVVTLADRNAFRVGGNLAVTEGEVVFRNRLLELIQYAPATETVHRVPLVIFPPWINKFYILDLRAQNSLVKWLVERGYTLFMVSWVNPDESHAEVGLDDYVSEGYLKVLEVVREITGEERPNVVGYCIAGTTLALTLALLKKRGERRVGSASFLTTLTDFSDPGEVGVFLADDFLGGIERQLRQEGILRALFMARSFSFLRSTDLIYRPAIRSYLMGEPPPAFDLLYWNGDGANLPGRMALEYLHGLCRDNLFAKGAFPLLGERLSLRDVTVPLCAVACEGDHIAPWSACYDGFRQMGARSKSFILSQSGHVAGIVNPPGRSRYGHYTNPDARLEHAAWRAGATFHEGSWWPRWEAWLKRRSGRMIPARKPGSVTYPPLCPAPGTYVLKQARG